MSGKVCRVMFDVEVGDFLDFFTGQFVVIIDTFLTLGYTWLCD